MKRFDWTILLGFAIGLAAIIIAVKLEGLNIAFLWNPTAALMVGGGTLGAVIARRGLGGVLNSVKAVWKLQIKDNNDDSHKVELARLAWLARSANKNGVKIYESYVDSFDDALVEQGLTLLAESADKEQITAVLNRRINFEQNREMRNISTIEAAGGYAPTFGILGAVIGLISVLRVLDQPGMLGTGIAAAFVATIYGIGSANLFFFPLAARLRNRSEKLIQKREELSQVLISLADKKTPRAIINQFNLRQ